MTARERDAVSGRETTGHEWNGIKELDTPVPKGILIFLIVTHVFAILWWFLMPAWPLGWTYTKGLLGTNQHERVEQQLAQAAVARSAWEEKIASLSFDEIQANEQLMDIVRQTGHKLFGDNCAACHRADATGGSNYPDLTDDDWIWGGEPETIAETLRVGINSPHGESRMGQMPAFGRDQMLERKQVVNVANYVYSLSHPEYSTAANIDRIEAGHEVFVTTCAPCHGEDARGSQEIGAPNLTDTAWIYGGDLATIISSVHGGRQGHMPTWEERLTPVDIKILALYVHSLSVARP
ncbi:cytochrome-c oxidase, cbb3-type subunit III [Aurantimonas sp. VKM B-3413]|uniref:cytochrome-c oxidase, cbb3-type subunit III n=1 Tax=Aurantimonas sp. VKM B-3413 TaxID=2779401 RepID=UPI001E2DAAB1|nr:cytochrome-c oxidase, cbb3-type subunit III [Aurantimonas sp. VKM B-3413]MCB8836783.1 cytochrome-c oxidase, cbb3-type subunit III [Aurantimonas sp. VKM B-3413]